MKSITLLFITIISSFFLFFTVPTMVSADGCSDIEASISKYDVGAEFPELPKYCSVSILVRKFLNIAFSLIGSITVLFIIIGGFRYLTARGNAETAEQGRKTVLYATLGLVVVILATLIVNIIVNLIVYDKLL